jgi:hypothetical protein
VLSTFYLGCEIITSTWIKMTLADYREALRVLREDRFADALAV